MAPEPVASPSKVQHVAAHVVLMLAGQESAKEKLGMSMKWPRSATSLRFRGLGLGFREAHGFRLSSSSEQANSREDVHHGPFLRPWSTEFAWKGPTAEAPTLCGEC